MKSIQKNLKAFFVFIAFLLCSFMFVLTPLKIVPVNAAEIPSDQDPTQTEDTSKETHKTFTSIHMPKKVDFSKSETLKIPLLTEANYTIRVVDKGGFTHDYSIASGEGTGSETFFEMVKKSGDVNDYLTIRSKASNKYRIFYIVEKSSTLYFSDAYEVEVVGTTYGLETKQVTKQGEQYTETNLNNLFPTKEKVGATLTLPKMYGYSEVNDKRTYDKEATISVTYAGNPASAEMYDAKTGVVTFTEKGRYVITYTYENTNSAERYTSEHVINVEEDFVAPDASKNQIKLPDSITLPTNVKLGDSEVVLPNPALQYRLENLNSNDAQKNVLEIEIRNVNTGVSKKLTNNNFTFNFTPEEFEADDYLDLEGEYEITYKVQGYYGEVTATYDWGRFTKDSVKPTIQAVYNYEAFDENGVYIAEDKIKPALGEIKAEYDYTASGGLLFPAAYVNSPVDNYDDLLVVRYFQNTETAKRYYIDGIKIDSATNTYVAVNESDGFNYIYSTQADEDKTNVPIVPNDDASEKKYFEQLSKSAIFKFAKEDTLPNGIANQTFRLCYEVKVKSSHVQYSTNSGGYNRQNALYQEGTSNEYTFKIVSGSETSTDLAVNVIKNYSTTAYVGNTIRFNVNATDSKDMRLINAMYYSETPFTFLQDGDRQQKIDQLLNKAKADYTNDYKSQNGGYTQIGLGADNIVNYMEKALKEELKPPSIFGKLTAVEGSDTQFNLEIPSDAHGKKLYILAITINDNGKVEMNNSAVINVANTAEQTAPTVASAYFYNDATKKLYEGTENAVAGQGEKVYIPTVTFSDEDKYLYTSVAYYVIPEDTNGKVEDTTYQNQYRYPEEYNLSNTVSGYIKTDKVGTYVIVYTATDDAGNTTVVHYSFKVASTAQPNIVVDVTGDNCDVGGSKTDGYSVKVGNTINVNVHAYDGNDNNIELPHDDKLKIEVKPVNVQGKDIRNAGTDENSYTLNSAGRYSFEVNVTWDSGVEGRDKITIPTYMFNVTAELDNSENIVWDNNFNLPEYFSYIEGDNKLLQLPQWSAEAQEGYVYKTALLYKGPSDSVWSEAKLNETTGKWEFEPKSIGRYELSYETYAIHGGVEYYGHKEKTITYSDNVEPTFVVNNGALDDKLTYNDKDITIQVKLDKYSKVMIITASEGDKKLYTWTSYNDENKQSDNANFKIVENTNDPNGDPRENYSWVSAELTVALQDSSGNNIDSTDSTDGDYTVNEYTISSTGTYKFVFTAKDTAKNVGTYEIEFSVTTKAEPTRLSDSQIGIILIVVSSVILIGVILFFLLTGKGGKKQKPTAISNETESKKPAKKSSRKSSKKAEKVEEEPVKDSNDKDAE